MSGRDSGDRGGVAGARPGTAGAELRFLVCGWVIGTTVTAALEWALLVLQARDQFTGWAQRFRILPFELGNLLPYALVPAALFLLGDVATSRVGRHLRRARLAVAMVAGVLSLPYATWLARYAFSGPQAAAMSHRALLMTALGGFVAVSVAAGFWFAELRRSHRRWAPWMCVLLVVGAGATLWLSRAGLHNDYEPLHAFLGVWSIVFGQLAGREIALELAERRPPRPRAIGAVAAVAIGWAGVSIVHLGRTNGDAWILWSETGATRYVTRRFVLRSEPPRAEGDIPMVIEPVLRPSEAVTERARGALGPAPHIVVFSIDGLRRDRVGAYGGARNLTPNIDRFAARGVRFTKAYSSFPETQAFNSSVLLGRQVPLLREVQQPPGYRGQAITHLLDGRGYHIFVKSWFELSSRNTFDPSAFAIDRYVPKTTDTSVMEEPMEQRMALLAQHLDEARAANAPVFVWMHLLGTHHMKGKGFVGHPAFDLGDSEMDRYDSAVAGSDLWLARIEELMAERLPDGRPVIWILTADHGINTHTRSRDLHDGVARVPLVIVAPGVQPATLDVLVDVPLDVAATVVDVAGVSPPEAYEGISLVPLLYGADEAPLADRLVPLEYVRSASGAVYKDFKYLQQNGASSLFDLAADPGERRNAIGSRDELARRMAGAAAAELRKRRRAAKEAGGAPL